MFFEDYDYGDDEYSDRCDEDYDRLHFADPGSGSALRAATPDNPRNRPCPQCGKKNRLTPEDVACGYRCNECASRAERGLD